MAENNEGTSNETDLRLVMTPSMTEGKNEDGGDDAPPAGSAAAGAIVGGAGAGAGVASAGAKAKEFLSIFTGVLIALFFFSEYVLYSRRMGSMSNESGPKNESRFGTKEQKTDAKIQCVINAILLLVVSLTFVTGLLRRAHDVFVTSTVLMALLILDFLMAFLKEENSGVCVANKLIHAYLAITIPTLNRTLPTLRLSLPHFPHSHNQIGFCSS